MPDVTVCIPWRPSPSRIPLFKRVMEFWTEVGWPVVTADSDTEVFSLAQARNNAVRKADSEIVVISDADTIPTFANVADACAITVEDPVGVCWPFTNYRIIDPRYLDTPFDRLSEVPIVNDWDGDGFVGVGGCLVAASEEFWRLGGQPPEFIGWGWEDTAFTYIAQTLSTVRRIKGHIYSFEHNTHAEEYIGGKSDSPGWDRDNDRNQELVRTYRAALGRAWLMRELIKRRDDGAMPPYIGQADAGFAGGGPPSLDTPEMQAALVGRFTQ